MGKLGTWIWGGALLLALGCAGNGGAVAQDEAGKPETQTPEAPRKEEPAEQPKATGDEEEKEDTRRYAARIIDVYQPPEDKPFVVEDVALFVPEVSLFGGSGGKRVKTFELRKGAATIEVPFARIAKITVGKVDEDLLNVTIELRDTKPEHKTLTGKVKANLELRGTFVAGDLETNVKLRETKEIELAPAQEG